MVELCGGLVQLEKLQSHPNTHIYKKALDLIEEYFGTEDDTELAAQKDAVSIFNF